MFSRPVCGSDKLHVAGDPELSSVVYSSKDTKNMYFVQCIGLEPALYNNGDIHARQVW